MKSRALVMFILLLALAVLISACAAKVETTTTTLPSGTGQSTINTPLPSPLETSKDATSATTASHLIVNKVSLSGYYVEWSMYENSARGRVENAGEELIVDVSIRVEFIDERGEPFCEKIVDIGDIQPGQEVPFVATCISQLVEADSWTYEILLGEAGLINSTISQNR